MSFWVYTCMDTLNIVLSFSYRKKIFVSNEDTKKNQAVVDGKSKSDNLHEDYWSQSKCYYVGWIFNEHWNLIYNYWCITTWLNSVLTQQDAYRNKLQKMFRNILVIIFNYLTQSLQESLNMKDMLNHIIAHDFLFHIHEFYWRDFLKIYYFFILPVGIFLFCVFVCFNTDNLLDFSWLIRLYFFKISL